MKRIVLILCFLLIGSIGIADAQNRQVVFSDDFERGRFRRGWTEVNNFEVIQDTTLGRKNYVASVVNQTEYAHLFKGGLSLGIGTIARVFFYDDGLQDGDDHSAGLDGAQGSIGIWARYYVDPDNKPNSTNYIFDHGGLTVETDIQRTVGWHEFRFAILPKGAHAYIDGLWVGTVENITAAEEFWIASDRPTALWDDVEITISTDTQPQLSFSGTGNIAYISKNKVKYSCDEGIGNCLRICLIFDKVWEGMLTYDTWSGVAFIDGFNRSWERGVPFTALINPESTLPEGKPTFYFTFRGYTAQMSLSSAPDVQDQEFVFRLQSIRDGLSGDFILHPRDTSCR